MTRKLLLVCGIFSSIVYVAANVACAARWREYSSFSQTISELSAIGAPSRSTWLPFGIVYDALVIAFGIGVWQCAPNRRVRASGAILLAIGVFGAFWPPMHVRGTETTLTDTLHVVWAGVISALIFAAIGLGATALGRRFRRYSITTIVLLLVAGASTFAYAPKVPANLPTPGFGMIERINLALYLAWMVVLAIGLLRAPTYTMHDERSGGGAGMFVATRIRNRAAARVH